MKNVLVISTSLRSNSNSETLADEFIRGAQESGNQTEKVSLRSKSISFCRGCFACLKNGRCAINDDANAIVEKIDDFDLICHIAYDKAPLTKAERANNVRKRGYLYKYSGLAQEVLSALLNKYMNEGIQDIENIEILSNDPFRKFGTPMKIAKLFGGKNGYIQAIRDLQKEIYAA